MTPAAPVSRSAHPALLEAHWPEMDRQAWSAAVRPAGFLDPGGPAATWRPATLRSAVGAYGRWLAWLEAEGMDLAQEAPAERLTQERLRRYLQTLSPGRSPITVASYIGVLWMMARALCPERDWAWLRRVHFHLRSQARPVRDKLARLVPAQEGVQLGLDLMEAAGARLSDQCLGASDTEAYVAAARDFRDGLIVGLLSLCPLRVKNLLAIQIGKQLHHAGRRVTLSFGGAETKTRKAIEHTWPPTLLPYLQRYLTEVRPILLASTAPLDPVRPARPAGAHLWVAQGGTALSAGGLQKVLRRQTTRRFDRSINAHAFRASAASTIAGAAPGRIDMAQALLGHAKPTTTEAHHVVTDARLALSEHHDFLASMRKAARQRRKFNAPKGS